MVDPRSSYSPMMPSAKSCAPEKMAMIDARNGKPGNAPPVDRSTPDEGEHAEAEQR